MDIREIKTSPPEVGVKYLEKIYDLQKVLIDHYIGLEGLPQYPLDINLKESQALLKDFSSRVIEELAEGYEAYLKSIEITKENLYWSGVDSHDKVNPLLEALLNFNEEQADAMHFMVELLIFSNIQPEDIKSFILKKCDISLVDVSPDSPNILDLAMEVGYSFFMDFLGKEPLTLYESVSYIPSIDYSVLTGNCSYTDYLRAGMFLPIKEYTGYVEEVSTAFLWNITYYLNCSRFCLKNKPWKQSTTSTNEELYQTKLVESFLLFAGYQKFIGMSSEDVYHLYFKKNMVNQNRIQSKY